MARPTAATTVTTGESAPPPADESASLKAEVERLKKEQAEQTARYRDHLARLQTAADSANAKADRLAAREEQVRKEASERTWKEEADAAASPDGGTRRYRCRIPADPCVYPRVVAASSVGEARERYLKVSGIVSTGWPVEAVPTDEPPTTVTLGMYFDVRRQRWVDPNLVADPEPALA